VGVNRIFVHGLGAVSPAGWGVTALRDALQKKKPIPVTALARPGWEKPLYVRPVPPPLQRPAFLAHPRLRRASVISQHSVAAALEALGGDAAHFQKGEERLGILVCLMTGSVTYSRRFYEEVMNDPYTASPLLFPETVFNAAGSHLAACLNSQGVSYTLVGDDSAFLQGLAVGAGWLLNNQVDGCLILGAEEMDWLVADALRLFTRQAVQAGGAGAVYFRREAAVSAVELAAITDAFPFSSAESRNRAARAIRAQLAPDTGRAILSLGTQGWPSADADELEAWRDWKGCRIAPKELLGEAFTASAAWQCVAACDALVRGEFEAANVSVVGANQQAIGVRFLRSS
jgi:hypothetical protein